MENLLSSLLFGDELKYTETMFENELGLFALEILEAKGIVTMKELKEFKRQFKENRQKEINEEIRKLKKETPNHS